jgi:hypothetical protein
MNEYREIVDVQPVRLYTDDLCELERVVRDSFECPAEGFEITAEFGAKRVSAGSVQELLSHQPPKEPDSLHIRAFSRKKSLEIDASLTIDISRRRYVSYQLAAKSESLFYGKRGQLDAFFKDRCPWYGGVRRYALMFVPGVIPLLLSGAFLFAVLRHDWLSMSLLVLTAGLLARVVSDISKGKLFPYAHVVLAECPAVPPKYQLALAALNIIVVLCTITRVLLALARK